MKIGKNDTVKIIAGKDKGKVAKVLKVFKSKGKVVVEGVNIVKKHIKPGKASKTGGIVSMEKPIDSSNVMFFDEKVNSPVRVGSKIIDGRKYRVSQKSKDVIEEKNKK